MDQGPLSERVVPICSNGFLSLVHPYSLVIAHKAVSAISCLILLKKKKKKSCLFLKPSHCPLLRYQTVITKMASLEPRVLQCTTYAAVYSSSDPDELQ